MWTFFGKRDQWGKEQNEGWPILAHKVGHDIALSLLGDAWNSRVLPLDPPLELYYMSAVISLLLGLYTGIHNKDIKSNLLSIFYFL